MGFKKLLQSLGVGGPSVDTVLAAPTCQPGGVLTGEVRVLGGDHPVAIEHIALELATRVEVEVGDDEHVTTQGFGKTGVAGSFQLAPGQQIAVPFQFPVPWETPLTEVFGQHLHGMSMGLRTELAVAKAVDKGDHDPVSVAPLPSQLRVLDSFAQLGFQFRKADNERGHIRGVHQTLPFYQEIEFHPPHQLAGRVKEVELTFVADPQGLTVVLEADKRGFLGSSHDAIGRWHVSHAEAMQRDWAGEIQHWLMSRR